MTESLQAHLWPASQLAAAQASAARHSRLAAAVPEPIDAHYAELGARLFDSAPALVRIDTTLDAGYALVVGRRGRCLLLLGPDLRVHPIAVDVVRSGLCAAIEAPLLPAIDRLLVAADLPPSRRGAARTALLRQQLAARPVSGINTKNSSSLQRATTSHSRMARRKRREKSRNTASPTVSPCVSLRRRKPSISSNAALNTPDLRRCRRASRSISVIMCVRL